MNGTAKGPPPKQPFDAMAKVAVIGDSSVGKTNILLRYTHADYQMTHIATIGIDFKVKKLLLDGFRLKMQIWDTAGQQRYRNLSGTIYQGAEAIILVRLSNIVGIFDHQSQNLLKCRRLDEGCAGEKP